MFQEPFCHYAEHVLIKGCCGLARSLCCARLNSFAQTYVEWHRPFVELLRVRGRGEGRGEGRALFLILFIFHNAPSTSTLGTGKISKLKLLFAQDFVDLPRMLRPASFFKNLSHFAAEAVALRARDLVKLFLDAVNQGQGAVQLMQTVLKEEAVRNAVGLAWINLLNHCLDGLQIISIEDGCLQAHPSGRYTGSWKRESCRQLSLYSARLLRAFFMDAMSR